MNEIRSLIKMARRRLELGSFLASLHIVAIVGAVVALALAVIDRLPAESFVPWTWLAPVLAVICVLVAALLWRRHRLSELQVAVTVDERLQLRERLSTALHCHDRDDAFAQAAVDDAVTAARDPRSWETARRRFVVRPPETWWISPLVVVGVVGVLLLGQADLFAVDEPAKVRDARAESSEAIQAIIKTVEEKPELREELAGLIEELGGELQGTEQLERPEDVKRPALKRVTELNRRLDELLTGQKGKTEQALKDMLKGLRPPEDGPARELAEALSEGDFAGAKEALEKMLSELENGSLSEAQKEQLAAQLKDIAKQMEQLAQQQKALEEALKRAGMNPQLANNPQALQQALEQSQNLNEQQRQQIQQMIQAQQAAQQMCQGMGGACQQLAQGMQPGGQLGQGGQQMLNQLNAMEQLQVLMQQAQAAANECQGQGMGLGQGMNLNEALQQWGGGMGRRGQGSGGKAPMARTPTGRVLKKADVPSVDGEIIASMLIDGQPIRGDSKAKLRDVVESGAKGFDEALSENPLPSRYTKVQQHYFGELSKQVEAMPVVDETGSAGDTGEATEGSAESSPSDAGSGS